MKYAQDRNVTNVPEIDLSGHSLATVTAYPELNIQKDNNTFVNQGANIADWYEKGTYKLQYDNTSNPSDEKV